MISSNLNMYNNHMLFSVQASLVWRSKFKLMNEINFTAIILLWVNIAKIRIFVVQNALYEKKLYL